MCNATGNLDCVLVVDVDGTLIPVLVDFERLRGEVRRLLGVEHPLKPLGESIAALDVDNDLKRRTWELVDRVELESISKLKLEDVRENVESLVRVVRAGAKLVLVSMRSSTSMRPLLLKLGLGNIADLVITRDHSPRRVDQLRRVLSAQLSSRVVFIGDTVYDENAARTLGVSFVRVNDYREFPQALQKALEKCKSP